MDRKTIYAALFLLFVLYVVGVGIGSGQSDVDPDIDNVDVPGWTEWLSSLADRPLRSEDVTVANRADCLQALKERRFVLDSDQTCTFTVEETASRFRTRTLRLTLTQGSGAPIEFDPRGEESDSYSETLGRGDSLIVRFMRRGGVVRISCTSVINTCHIGVEE